MDRQGHTGYHRTSSNCNTECVEKVEAMISTAILHQEDVWNMLSSLFPDSNGTPAAAEESGYGDPQDRSAGQSHIPEAVMEKLEKAMDWCRLAQCRLKGLIPENHPSARRGTSLLHCAS